MKLTFLDISSSYSHSSLALPMLERACHDSDGDWSVVRGTLNDPSGDLALKVQESAPDMLLATLYLFTHEAVMKVVKRATILCPNAMIVLGGPEFLGDNEQFLRTHPEVAAVVCGEGEVPLKHLLADVSQTKDWSAIPGLCFLSSDSTYHSSVAEPAPWPPAQLPYESPFFDWAKPFIQVESSRGCNQSCGFCTSANTGGPNWLPIDRLRDWLQVARRHGITDIRMLDRTFNASPKEAGDRLKLFVSEFADMHFHLEVHPAFLPNSLRSLLRNAPEGMFHLEVGIQSTGTEVQKVSGRAGRVSQVLDGLSFLCSCPNLQVHTDLISGLPGVTYSHLLEDVERILRLKPDEIQLEILKILPGTQFKRDHKTLGLSYADDPPYEVLITKSMSAGELKKSMILSKLIDRFYNQPMLRPVFQHAFDENEAFLAEFLEAVHSKLTHPISLRRRALLLFAHLQEHQSPAVWTLAYQWMMQGYSPSQCPVPIERWYEDIPDNATMVYQHSEPSTDRPLTWTLPTPSANHYFIYDKKLSQSKPVYVATEQ